jgi:serine protease
MRRAVLLLSLGLVVAPAAARADAPATGRLLVTLRHGAAQRVTAAAVAATADARPAGYSVPQIRLVTLRARPGRSLRALAARLRADRRVAHVEVEHRARLRLDPNDPALTTPETAAGTAPGTAVEWWAARSGFPQAWGVSTGAGATVAVIDTGAETSHPELADRTAGSVSFDPDSATPTVDTVGHGTHVASLACGAGNNGIGLAGAGLRCRLLIIKSDFSDSSVAKAIVWAVDHGADAINMSFGTDPGPQPSQAVRDAVDYAVDHDVVLAAAAADSAIAEQGYPADLLQPSGTGPNLSVDKGLSVTAADAFDHRASFAGEGSQISLAAYGTYDAAGNGPPGIFGAFTAGPNELETGSVALPPRPPCSCRTTFAGDSRYAYVQGTSMATPMVAATGALMRHLNPDLSSDEIVQVIKQTAHRPPGTGWTSELGWGILDAGAALTRAAALDRRAPLSRVRPLPGRTTAKRTLTLRWSGSDPAPAGVRSSGISRYELWRSTDGAKFRRLFSTPRTSRQVTLRRGGRYRFYTVAVDHAGNREAAPARPDVSVTRRS